MIKKITVKGEFRNRTYLYEVEDGIDPQPRKKGSAPEPRHTAFFSFSARRCGGQEAASCTTTYTPAGTQAAQAPSLSSQPNCSQI